MSTDQLEAERKLFEGSLRNYMPDGFERHSNGRYASDMTYGAWLGWQAARSQPAAPRVVSESDIDRAIDSVDAHYCRHGMVTRLCARIILESIAPTQPSVPVAALRVQAERWESTAIAALSSAAYDLRQLIAAHGGKGNGDD